jgi:integrase
MAKKINKLTARTAETLKNPGLYGDGNGLYLRIIETGARSWMFRYMIAGRARTMGLGPFRLVPLAEARAQAIDLQRRIRSGVDPLNDRAVEKSISSRVQRQTFKECAEAYVSAQAPGWRNKKHAAQWASTLAAYCYPKIGGAAVADVSTDDVMDILEPIWGVKPETAARVRGRIENVLDWASARKLRHGENPARWRGHLDKLLPAKSKVRKVTHFPALSYPDVGAFFSALKKQNGCAARALQFCILTATRTNETLGARWSEFDLERGWWTIPQERMKAGRSHRVPLSSGALSIISEMNKVREGEQVFPSLGRGGPMSNMAMSQVLKRMGRPEITVHGFRSTFRDWVAEKTEYPNELVEMALAHAISDRAEAAYRRGDMLERRQRLMEEWHLFLKVAP